MTPAGRAQAIPGYYGAAGAAATACPANSYCQTGTERPVACPAGTQSTAVANDVTDCVSSPGFYGPSGTPPPPPPFYGPSGTSPHPPPHRPV